MNTTTAERPQTQTAPPPPAESKGELVQFQKPRLPYHPGFEETFGISKGQWKVLVEATFPAAKTTDSVVMAINYCKARGLDIFKKPVHIVPMWSSQAGGYVETIWPSIGELRTTAFRTGQYAGCDAAELGPETEKKFSGKIKVKEQWKDTEVTVKFPEWCRITVYRVVQGIICKFVGPKVKWLETYAAIGASDIPNEMWQSRSEGQLEKCAEAASLRKAFPEEIGNDYTAEEMAGRRIISEEMVAAVAPQRPAGPPPPPADEPAQQSPSPGPNPTQPAAPPKPPVASTKPAAKPEAKKAAPPPPADNEPPLSAYEDAMGASDGRPVTWGEEGVTEGEFTEVFDETQWLKDLDGALGGETDVVGVGQMQQKMMAPMKDKVSAAGWAKATEIAMGHARRAMGGK